ncbi:craniofacial development protein 2-like [Penaeus chinensis]|uniref:craniofacial development protein 2-like n=1 Tax=Penaeus chinensis TaxID=139456 RepID=UPI001FB6410A|nr:craniofacial development protein 2-like [Penaeus chinensis]
MCPGLSPNIQQVDDARKTAVIDRELSRLGVDIACLQETRLADSGTLREKSYTFFWKGKPPEEPRQHGVGFAIKNTLMTSIEPPSAGTERILTLRLSTSFGSATIISVYAPTLYSTPEDKDQFYGALDDIISQTPSTDMLYLLGDFNARVGADHEAWLSCLGAYGRGKINDNGQRLLELCCYHGLCVTNTFPCKEIDQVSWRHPRSRHWHQLDLVLTRRKDLASVLLTRTYHSADCDTDHSLVASKEDTSQQEERTGHASTPAMPETPLRCRAS